MQPNPKTLAQLITRRVFSIYLLLAFSLTLVQIGLEYRSTRTNVMNELRSVTLAFEPGVAQALWNFQESQVRATAQGMLSTQLIAGVRIRDVTGSIDVHISNIPSSASSLSVMTPLWYEHPGTKQKIGEFLTFADEGIIFQRMREGVPVIFIAALIKTLGLWCIAQFFVRQLLARPLKLFTKQIEKVDGASNLAPLPELTSPASEWVVLADAFNRLIVRLQEKERSLLDLTQTMEQKVAQRTQELANRNRELALERDYVSTMLDVVPEGLMVLDEQGVVERINPHAAAQLGLGTDLLTTIFDWLLPAQHSVLRECMERIVEHGQQSCEVTVPRDGVPRTYLLVGALVAREPSVRMVMLLIDISAQKEAEASNKAKSRFLAALGHDLRQPANALGIYLSLLQSKLPGHELHSLLGKAMDCQATMAYVFDSLLYMARIESKHLKPNVQPVALQNMWHRLANLYEPKALCKQLQLRMAPTTVVVRADEFMLERILSNLLANAIRYTERGCVTVGVRQGRGRVRIYVADTGIDIPVDVRTQIFDDFFQVAKSKDQHQGAGLGLSIVAGLAEQLGLQYRLFSKAGHGTLFLLTLDHTHHAMQ